MANQSKEKPSYSAPSILIIRNDTLSYAESCNNVYYLSRPANFSPSLTYLTRRHHFFVATKLLQSKLFSSRPHSRATTAVPVFAKLQLFKNNGFLSVASARELWNRSQQAAYLDLSIQSQVIGSRNDRSNSMMHAVFLRYMTDSLQIRWERAA